MTRVVIDNTTRPAWKNNEKYHLVSFGHALSVGLMSRWDGEYGWFGWHWQCNSRDKRDGWRGGGEGHRHAIRVLDITSFCWGSNTTSSPRSSLTMMGTLGNVVGHVAGCMFDDNWNSQQQCQTTCEYHRRHQCHQCQMQMHHWGCQCPCSLQHPHHLYHCWMDPRNDLHWGPNKAINNTLVNRVIGIYWHHSHKVPCNRVMVNCFAC